MAARQCRGWNRHVAPLTLAYAGPNGFQNFGHTGRCDKKWKPSSRARAADPLA
jgi:hypothetical protein